MHPSGEQKQTKEEIITDFPGTVNKKEIQTDRNCKQKLLNLKEIALLVTTKNIHKSSQGKH